MPSNSNDKIVLEGIIVPGESLDLDGWKRSILQDNYREGDKAVAKRTVHFSDEIDDQGRYDYTLYRVIEG